MKFFTHIFHCLIFLSFFVTSSYAESVPGLLLAKIYRSDIPLEDYWVSEKYDGVRAYWNGKQLISRQGHVFKAPEWFTAAFPESTSLDGELWLGRGRFEQLSGLVRRQSPADSDWRGISYLVFDLPDSPLNFDGRLKQLTDIIPQLHAPHIQLVEQNKISSHQFLLKKLESISEQGGEGLMLHRGSSLYKNGRHDDLLKLKPYFDAEAVVIGYIPGKGKYTGMLGSLEVETLDKKRFKIGSGFSDAERKKPPAIGSTITYKYFGLTNKGIPRFASFLRVRHSH